MHGTNVKVIICLFIYVFIYLWPIYRRCQLTRIQSIEWSGVRSESWTWPRNLWWPNLWYHCCICLKGEWKTAKPHDQSSGITSYANPPWSLSSSSCSIHHFLNYINVKIITYKLLLLLSHLSGNSDWVMDQTTLESWFDSRSPHTGSRAHPACKRRWLLFRYG